MNYCKYLWKYLPMLAACLALNACSSDEPEGPEDGTGTETPIDPTPDQPGDGTLSLEIPDVDGMTLKGVVYCGSKPLADVVVSDGFKTTKTDANGVYYLASEKKSRYVMISNPAGYKVKQEGIYPQFYQRLSGSAKQTDVEQFNFELSEDPTKDYVMMFLADTHLANRYDDKLEFETLALPDINRQIDDYKAQGKNTYVVTLGDQSWDIYWYDNKWAIPETKAEMSRINATALYNCMGNHDHDPHIAGDFAAAVKFRQYWGPNYYSFNIGQTHYVVLDNINYKNPGATEDDRSYTEEIVPEVLTWLKNDLSYINKSTHVVLCMHAPFLAVPMLESNGKPREGFYYDYGQTLYNVIKDFNQVTVMTGHAHKNSSNTMGNVKEYNIAAVCGVFWWTARPVMTARNHLGKDGSPGGYRIAEVTDNTFMTFYKSLTFDRTHQFRAYDLNNCCITSEKYCPGKTYSSDFDSWIEDNGWKYWAPGGSRYNADGTPKVANKVLINVYAYDAGWKVDVKENGKSLKATQINCYDPYFLISGAALYVKNLNKRPYPTSTFEPTSRAHFFEVTASSPTSTLDITVTDCFGNVYTEKMTRPLPFEVSSYLPK